MQYRLAYIMWNSLLAWKNLSETGMKMSTLVLCTVLPPDHTTPGLHHYTYISFMMSVSLQLKWFSFTTSLHFTQYLVTFYLFTLNIMVHNDFSLIKKGGGGGTFCGSTACRVCVCVLLFFIYIYIYFNDMQDDSPVFCFSWSLFRVCPAVCSPYSPNSQRCGCTHRLAAQWGVHSSSAGQHIHKYHRLFHMCIYISMY